MLDGYRCDAQAPLSMASQIARSRRLTTKLAVRSTMAVSHQFQSCSTDDHITVYEDDAGSTVSHVGTVEHNRRTPLVFRLYG